jgi:hypothetical protein
VAHGGLGLVGSMRDPCWRGTRLVLWDGPCSIRRGMSPLVCSLCHDFWPRFCGQTSCNRQMKQLADMESCEGRKRESLAAIIQYLQSAGRSSVGSVLRACEHGPALGTLRHSLSVWYSLARCWRYFVAHGLNRPHLGCDLGSGAMPCPSHRGHPRSMHRWRCRLGA